MALTELIGTDLGTQTILVEQGPVRAFAATVDDDPDRYTGGGGPPRPPGPSPWATGDRRSSGCGRSAHRQAPRLGRMILHGEQAFEFHRSPRVGESWSARVASPTSTRRTRRRPPWSSTCGSGLARPRRRAGGDRAVHHDRPGQEGLIAPGPVPPRPPCGRGEPTPAPPPGPTPTSRSIPTCAALRLDPPLPGPPTWWTHGRPPRTARLDAAGGPLVGAWLAGTRGEAGRRWPGSPPTGGRRWRSTARAGGWARSPRPSTTRPDRPSSTTSWASWTRRWWSIPTRCADSSSGADPRRTGRRPTPTTWPSSCTPRGRRGSPKGVLHTHGRAGLQGATDDGGPRPHPG